MSERTRDKDRARSEAAAWFVGLGRRSVTTDALRAFRAWRGKPQNAAAYAEVEAAWTRAGDLSSDPDILAATASALERRPWRARLRDALRGRLWLVWSVAGAAAAAVALALLAPLLLSPTYSTGVGEQRLVVLEDGSRVRLNTDSRVRIRYTGDERRIALTRSEAFFEAAKDPRRPFVVDAGRAEVRALGTRFGVRRDDGRVEVTLVEGAVRVAEPAGAWTLKPGQQIALAAGRAPQPRAADLERATSWTEGRLTFRETPLAEAVAEVNRYGRAKVRLADPALARAPVSGVFDTGDTAAFAAAVSVLFGLETAPQPDGTLLLKPPAA